jgi:hypothetical protein
MQGEQQHNGGGASGTSTFLSLRASFGVSYRFSLTCCALFCRLSFCDVVVLLVDGYCFNILLLSDRTNGNIFLEEEGARDLAGAFYAGCCELWFCRSACLFYVFHLLAGQDVVSLIANKDSNGSADPDTVVSPRSKKRSPKKNRVESHELDDTKEEELEQEDDHEDGGDNEEEEDKMVMSVSGSPPHETKMRQISEGVGGIKMIKQPRTSVVAVTPDRDSVAELEDVFVDSVEEQQDKLELEPAYSAPITDTAADNNTPTLPEEPQPSSREVPTDEEAPESLAPLEPFPSKSSALHDHDPSCPRDSEPEDIEEGKMLKRKLGDRAVSESREAENGGKKASRKAVGDVASTTSTGSKRSRDEGDKDASPRETKRPSPPPEKREESSSTKDEGRTLVDVPEDPAATSPKSVSVVIKVDIRFANASNRADLGLMPE